MKIILLIIFIITLISYSCSKTKEPVRTNEKQENNVKTDIKLTSTAIADGSSIPFKYTCDGENISPPLQWNNTDEKVKSYSIIMNDPDAPSGDFVHWIIYDIPSSVRELSEGFSSVNAPKTNYIQGKNDAGNSFYYGPCPPSGSHRYIFNIYELDSMLNLKEGMTKSELSSAMSGHILAKNTLTANYQRKK